MAASPPPQSRHARRVYLAILGLLALSCLGFLVENRLAARRYQAQPLGLLGDNTEPLGLSGGRARGGTFDAPAGSSGGAIPAPGPGGPGGSFGGGYGGGPYYPPGGYPYPRTGPVVVPAPYPGGYIGYPGSTVTVGGDVGLLFLLAVFGFMVLPLLMNLMRLKGNRSSSGARGAGGGNELTNNRVTVTQLQVALLSQARSLQGDLDAMASRTDLDSKAGLSRLLQESVLALLRSPEYWAYARASSQTVASREQAAQVFEQLSVTERSKFSRETLVNVGGKLQRSTYTPSTDADPAAYIVVTLIVGTADDQPLLGQPIYSASDLQAALRRLGATTPDYLLVYELLWTPQDPADSLSYDQLLTYFPDLTQIA